MKIYRSLRGWNGEGWKFKRYDIEDLGMARLFLGPICITWFKGIDEDEEEWDEDVDEIQASQ